MNTQENLFGNTFDQQLEANNGEVPDDIVPNKRIACEVVLEPVHAGLRVTARDQEHKPLWGFIASEGMLAQGNPPVALYDNLRTLLVDELANSGLTTRINTTELEATYNSIRSLRKLLVGLHRSLKKIKKPTDATRLRAKIIRRVVSDAETMIQLEAPNASGK